MTRNKAKSILPLIQAYSEGRTIQIKGSHPPTQWIDADEKDMDLVFTESSVEWRVKPEPREGYVPAYAICFGEESAMILAKAHVGSNLGKQAEIIHVREVI